MQTSFCTINGSFIVPHFLKKFHFTDETDIIELSCSSSDSLCSASDQHVCGENCLNVKINEILDPEFGLYVWPSAPVLSKYIWICRNNIKNKKILELGAGTALPSIVAARCGAQVTITDSEKFKYVLKLGGYNMLSNNVSGDTFKISELTWGKFTPFVINAEQFDLILGSDVFYNPSDLVDFGYLLCFITWFICSLCQVSLTWSSLLSPQNCLNRRSHLELDLMELIHLITDFNMSLRISQMLFDTKLSLDDAMYKKNFCMLIFQ